MRKSLCAAALLLAFTAYGWAQKLELQTVASIDRMGRAKVGSNDFSDPVDDDTVFHNGKGIGLRFTLNPHQYYGHELTYIHSRVGLHTSIASGTKKNKIKTPYDVKVNVERAYYNFLMYMMPRNERWRPYLTAGLSATRYFNPKIEGWKGAATTQYGINYGIGIKFLLTKHALFRFDLRDGFTGKPYNLRFEEDSPNEGGRVRQQEASFGIGIAF
jgi:opacity protein-like surface antigen